MSDEHAPDWMQEQAAEYQDLVGSFVESVVDSDTDEMIEYQLIWEGGDLGVALTTLEGGDGGVAVSRVTGKGFPFGIKNVGPGDLLLSINMKDTTKITLDDVVAYLQVCDLPATLRFKKLSPGPTSPMGSAAPPSYPRGSTKYAPPPPSDRASMPVHKTPSDFPEPPAPPQRQSAKVPTSKKLVESPPKPAPKSVPKPEPVAFEDEPVYEEHHTAAKPQSPRKHEPQPVAPAPSSPHKSKGHKQPKAASPRQSVAPEEKLRELDGLVLTSGVNDLGFEDSEDESVRASRESRDSWRDESFDVDANDDDDDWKIDEEEKEDVILGDKKDKRSKAKDQFQREKSGSTVAMLGHFSVETKGDGVPILPDAEEARALRQSIT
ncbi:hypothetical protein KRP22_012717 [Phytophthora ramorum]|nr:hypothetical protein KRP22_13933 [Phytophthora ramorum]